MQDTHTLRLSGLAWFGDKAHYKLFKELDYACVYAIGTDAGHPLKVGWCEDPQTRLPVLQAGHWSDLLVHHIVWTAGDIVARRLVEETHNLLDKAGKRVARDWFAVTPEWVRPTIGVASRKTGVATFDHDEMLRRVAAERERRIDASVAAAGYLGFGA